MKGSTCYEINNGQKVFDKWKWTIQIIEVGRSFSLFFLWLRLWSFSFLRLWFRPWSWLGLGLGLGRWLLFIFIIPFLSLRANLLQLLNLRFFSLSNSFCFSEFLFLNLFFLFLGFFLFLDNFSFLSLDFFIFSFLSLDLFLSLGSCKSMDFLGVLFFLNLILLLFKNLLFH